VIRLTLLAIYVTGAAAYAWKDWYKSLCALILLMAVIEHPDMPKTILGVQGLNPWNLLLIAVVAAWATTRSQEGLEWDLPRPISVMLLLYLAVIMFGVVRMMLDRDLLQDSAASLISEAVINTIKWVIPGLLLYDGCRNEKRFRMAVVCVLGVSFLLAIQVIRWMPLAYAVSGDALSARSIKILMNEVGYHRVNISAMLAGGAWAIFAIRPLGTTSRQVAFVVAASLTVAFGQALTGGRAGYVTWMLVGLVLCALRWRKYLIVAPVAVLAILLVAPGAAERMLEGFSVETRDPNNPMAAQANDPLSLDPYSGPDVYTITAGRALIWPYVIDKIGQAPFIGYGRLAMVRTGLTDYLAATYNEGFAHPHNAYLEWLLDNGLIGFVIVMPFYGMVLLQAFALFRDSRNPTFTAIGGSTSAYLLALLIAGMGSQTFYPREGWVGMWCMIFLMTRVRVQLARAAPVAASAPIRAATAHRGFASPQPAPAPGLGQFHRPAWPGHGVPVPISNEMLWGATTPATVTDALERHRAAFASRLESRRLDSAVRGF
jgi:O-antigen ligase